jgi:RNase adaptor protein for sRNA GlmZ degradation
LNFTEQTNTIIIYIEKEFEIMNEMKPVYIVSGLPRSGTSMMMKMLEAGGLNILTDNIRAADDDNLLGYYEFERVKQLKEGDTTWVENERGNVVKVISALLEHLPNHIQYKIIFMEREMAEILASQRKMLERRGKPSDASQDGKFTELYGKHLEKVKTWLSTQPNIDVLYVRYNDLVSQPEEYINKINAFLHISLNTELMKHVPQGSYYRQRS